jgi:L-fuculose-phosphate aldolase
VSKAAKPQRKPASDTALRAEIISIAQRMNSSGLTPGKSGNVSARTDSGMLITPTGMAYGELKPSDIAALRADGSAMAGQRVPSSEWRFHLAIYKAREDVEAIVHTHSLNATALACIHRSIPAFHYMVAVAGGDRILCAPYATYGTEALAKNVVRALGDRRACLIANHGAVAVGETLRKAYDLAWEVETLSAQYARARQLGRPRVLSAREMNLVLEKFKTYGKQTPVKL